jgi:hypothetical protein
VVVFEVEEAAEGSAGGEVVEPVDVIGPHFVEGDVCGGGPEGDGFVCFGGGTGELVCAEDVAFEGEAVGKLEVEETRVFWMVGFNEEFLPGFADGAFGRGFSGVDFPAWAIDFSGSQSAFFADEEDLMVTEDEHEGGAEGGSP